MTAFTLAHLSDPHLPPLPKPRLRELLGKRALGYVNWVRNRKFRHAREIVDVLTADLLAQAPDHIAVTGDLVNIGLEAEFTPAIDWLRTIGSPHDVTLVPGNHDAYVASTWPRGVDVWRDYMRGDGAAHASNLQFPFERRRGPLLLIGTSTAVPTAPFMATGRLGARQIADLEALLSQHAADDAFKVLLIHHPPRSARSRRHKRLTDASDLLGVLRRHGVDLILHGHDHTHSLTWFDGPAGRIPAVGVPSASQVIDGKHDPAAYNLFRIVRDGHAWHCDWSVRGLASPETGVAELRQQELR
ncbi:metallophosphoesterase [Bradyrhizobium sp. LHD-71]|uniref:metallophosphoesterase family protein n=1 Tax=Bradyrhizobium sp. LHD-71 TaxID=3072141 RepID=UPI00280F75F2|nr:metallophosphoesterase [Bradyrhizobium sp. LHD-71]MDQ8727912.1 metallophosphoesterase [Bradyrhizobium sp. LHD-71]